jgi:DNA-binding NtrC family response regulator
MGFPCYNKIKNSEHSLILSERRQAVSGEHILIVEDELLLAKALYRALSNSLGGGYDVETCGSGETALKLLRNIHFDLLISDLRLPGINGLELIERARQIDPEIRSILITAYRSPQVEEQARRLANAYMIKPFRLEDLIQTVQRVLSKPAADEQS